MWQGILFVVGFTLAALSNVEPSFGDWPQINGPNRNGVAPNEVLLTKWPKNLKQIWSHPVGSGYAGPAVANGRLIVFHRPAKKYLVEALDAKT